MPHLKVDCYTAKNFKSFSFMNLDVGMMELTLSFIIGIYDTRKVIEN